MTDRLSGLRRCVSAPNLGQTTRSRGVGAAAQPSAHGADSGPNESATAPADGEVPGPLLARAGAGPSHAGAAQRARLMAQIPGTAVANEGEGRRTPEQLEAHWNAWAEEPCSPQEQAGREQAVQTLRRFMRQQSAGTRHHLNLAGCALTSLPELPVGIRSLNLCDNRLKALPALDDSITLLNVEKNQLRRLPELPPDLISLRANDNNLEGLPQLPPRLQILAVCQNKLTSVPKLPPDLRELFLSGNDVGQFSGALPSSLRRLDVEKNPRLSALPALPNKLDCLTASGCGLKSFPATPPGCVQHIDLSHNLISALPSELATGQIQRLNLDGNQIARIPNAFLGLVSGSYVSLEGNPLTQQAVADARRRNTLIQGGSFREFTFPSEAIDHDAESAWGSMASSLWSGSSQGLSRGSSSSSLASLSRSRPGAEPAAEPNVNHTPEPLRAQWDAWANEEASLASGEQRSWAVGQMHQFMADQAQGGTGHLDLSNASLTCLPPLPPGITALDLSRNHFTRLPALPSSITALEVRGNNLTELPELPPHLTVLNAGGNVLESLPAIPSSTTHLFLFGNRLTSLPALPPGLVVLDVDQNDLSELPHPLPSALQQLHACENSRLNELPALPPRLVVLTADRCALHTFPALPGCRMFEVELSSNQLSSLPNELATEHIKTLNLNSNRIANLPASVFGLDRQSEVMLENNPLSPAVIAEIQRRVNVPGNEGPQIHFSMGSGSGALPMRPLEEAAADWCAESKREAQTSVWARFAEEPGAPAFSQFLDRLQDTANHRDAKTRGPFRTSVAELLDRMANSPDMRADCFSASVGATESCEDRVTHTFNAMDAARVADDVRQGQFDHDLPALVDKARALYRRDALEGIAREKTASMLLVDPIEVHLAYQVKLNEPLGLGLNAHQMRFYDVSGVTDEDLQLAQARVQTAERNGFTPYLLNNCPPWDSAIKRLAPSLHQEMKDAVVEAVSGEAFTQRLSARLSELGDLQGAARADAERTVGHQVMAQVAVQAQWPYVERFLSERGVRSDATNLHAPPR